MKLLILALALLKVNDSQSSCIVQPKVENLLFGEQHYLYEFRPLENFLKYCAVRIHVINMLDVQLGKLSCNIKDFCTTKFDKVEIYFNKSYSFCELFFNFEHNKNIIFTIKRFETFFLSSENLTIDSNRVFNNSKNMFITKR